MKNRLAIVLIFTLLQAIALDAQEPLRLLDGTPVKLRLNRNLSSADAKEGETVDFEVLEEVSVGGVVVIARGAIALATVTKAQPKRRMRRSGKLDVAIDFVRLVDGEKAALRAVKEMAGGSNSGKMTGAIVATSIVFFPAAPLFLLVKGKDTTIPKGTEITGYVNGEVRLDYAKFSVDPKATPVVPVPAVATVEKSLARLTNSDVIELKTAGFPDTVILSRIRASPADFDMSTSAMIQLRKAGLSDEILSAMIERSK